MNGQMGIYDTGYKTPKMIMNKEAHHLSAGVRFELLLPGRLPHLSDRNGLYRATRAMSVGKSEGMAVEELVIPGSQLNQIRKGVISETFLLDVLYEQSVGSISLITKRGSHEK